MIRRPRMPRRLVVVSVVAMALSGCASNPGRSGGSDLAGRLDCLRERQLAVVAAHRGQTDPSAAENAMSSFRASLAAGIPFLEIDVATTRDGRLVLMHDDTLDRTTTGAGRVDNRNFADIRTMRLERADGTVLDEGVPSFAEVMAWGRKAKAYFEVDVKPTTKFTDVVAVIQDAKMVDRVVIVTYKLGDAALVHKLDPRLMISVTLDSAEAIAEARKVIDPNRMLGWTGTSNTGRQPFEALRAAGIEPIFGTLGRPGVRLDDVYLADGDGAEYQALVQAGVVMIASDAAAAAQKAIGDGYRACFR